MDISIHALREEGDQDFTEAPQTLAISIHALREEGDNIMLRAEQNWDISIHALREEGDAAGVPSAEILRNFYPRPPRGGRRSRCVVSVFSC